LSVIPSNTAPRKTQRSKRLASIRPFVKTAISKLDSAACRSLMAARDRCAPTHRHPSERTRPMLARSHRAPARSHEASAASISVIPGRLDRAMLTRSKRTWRRCTARASASA
jgi:hypothetical protein